MSETWFEAERESPEINGRPVPRVMHISRFWEHSEKLQRWRVLYYKQVGGKPWRKDFSSWSKAVEFALERAREQSEWHLPLRVRTFF